jgi:WhiB family redox-sensing transcriptional regulator
LFAGLATTAATDVATPDWSAALCATSGDPDRWFPETGESPEEAQAICRACPIRAECLEWALATDQRFGVWGGASKQERRRMKAGLRAPSPSGPEMTAVPAAQGPARLARGELPPMVAAHLDAWPETAFSASELARILGRSRGAIFNALTSLAADGRARLVSQRPARYISTTTRRRVPPEAAKAARGQLTAAIRELFASRAPGESLTSAEVTLAIGAQCRDTVTYALKRLVAAGEMVRFDGQRPRYAVAARGERP